MVVLFLTMTKLFCTEDAYNMRVVFLEDVEGVAHGGDVKEVKNGFARNYLIPKNLAVPANHNALQRVEKLSRRAGVTRIQLLSDLKELAQELDGRRVDVEMRAGSSGRLYGSVTNTIIADALSEMTASEIERRTVEIDEPIRDLGVYDLAIRLHPEVSASIQVVVYPIGTDPDDMIPSEEDEEASEDATAEVEEVAEAVAETTIEASTEEASDEDDSDDADSDEGEEEESSDDGDAEESPEEQEEDN
ncbi:MAG: 50S ribosomal protein L9 [SAR202 cluster bacterium]|nr:50S ribosomal protein L9 [SAR202 cluster bacterium]